MCTLKFVVTWFCLIAWFSVAEAQYVLLLKNGRQITVSSYREEGTMVKLFGLGGELGIPKDQILSITKAGESTRPGVSMIELEAAARESKPQKPSAPAAPVKDSAVSDEAKLAPAPDEEKEYQRKLAEVTKKLEEAKEKYFKATQGGGTSANLSKEGISAWTMDLASRIHDSQKVAGGGGPSSTPPTPPYRPNYTPKEKELSDLRAEIDDLQKQRDELIQEMKSKNIPTGR
jgi:hypothetical protein